MEERTRSVTVKWRLEGDEQEEDEQKDEGCLVETQRVCSVFPVCTFLPLRSSLRS